MALGYTQWFWFQDTESFGVRFIAIYSRLDIYSLELAKTNENDEDTSLLFNLFTILKYFMHNM